MNVQPKSDHAEYQAQLPLYVAGQLEAGDRRSIDEHLAACADCQADLDLWRQVSEGISTSSEALSAPAGLPERVLERIQVKPPISSPFQRAWGLLRAQALLMHREIWPASALVMALGVILAVMTNQARVLHFLAPLVAAAGLAVIYNPEHDPAIELAASTPTSPWKILLARLTLVSGYNLFLAAAASLIVLLVVPGELICALILGWLGPLTFLSALALLLSLWIGTGNAIVVSYGLWIFQYLQISRVLDTWMFSALVDDILAAYRGFWASPLLLLALSLILVLTALLSTRRTENLLTASQA